jgi:hypothetical protein
MEFGEVAASAGNVPASPTTSLTPIREEENLMARELGVRFGVLLLASIPAGAQVKVEVFGGYSSMRFNSFPGSNLNGCSRHMLIISF